MARLRPSRNEQTRLGDRLYRTGGGNIKSVILRGKDMFIQSSVLDKKEKQVIWSSNGLEFGRRIQIKQRLGFTVDILHP